MGHQYHFFDYLWICGPSTGGIPQQVNYDPSSSTPGLNETQKMWVGFWRQGTFSGECVEIDETQLNTCFPTQTQQTTPGTTPSQQTAACASGNTILN